MVKRAILPIVVVAVFGVSGRAVAQGAASVPTTASSAQPGDAARGKRLYEAQTCAYCHGTTGGGGITGPHLAATLRPVEAFTRYVRRPTGAMPAFTERMLSDEALTDIHAYVKSLPAAKPVAEIPLLKQLK